MIDPSIPRGDGALRGTVAVVTGAARNIGQAIATTLAERGAVVGVNDLAPHAVARTADQIRAAGGIAVDLPGDLTVPEVVDEVFARVERDYGTVGVLVNNAYVRGAASAWEPFLRVGFDAWQAFLAVNLGMVFLTTQRAARALAHAGMPGSIVNLSSFGAHRPHRRHIPYDTSKGAIEAFTRAVAVDLGPWGIRVNAVRPGTIGVADDPVWGDRVDVRGANIPLGRIGTTRDVAGVVAFLASPDSAYVTGQCLAADGGMTVQARPPAVEPAEPARPDTIGPFPRTVSPVSVPTGPQEQEQAQ